jgi:molybdopterin converting factor small subunit
MPEEIAVDVRVSGRLGGGTRRVRLAAGATVAYLFAALAPGLGLDPARLDAVAVALAGEIAGRNRPLRDGDAVALVLPVAGG